MACQHSPVTSPPSPPPRSASRAVRCRPCLPSQAARGTDADAQVPESPPDTGPRPGSPTPHTSGAGNPRPDSARRRKSLPLSFTRRPDGKSRLHPAAGTAGSPGHQRKSHPLPSGAGILKWVAAAANTQLGPGTTRSSPCGVGAPSEVPAEGRRAAGAQWRGCAEDLRVLTAAGAQGRPGLAQVGVHLDPSRVSGAADPSWNRLVCREPLPRRRFPGRRGLGGCARIPADLRRVTHPLQPPV